MYRTAFDLYRRLGSASVTGGGEYYNIPPWHISEAGTQAANGIYYAAEDITDEWNGTFDKILFRHEDGVFYIRVFSVKTGQTEIFGTIVDVYRVTYELRDASTVFYQHIRHDRILMLEALMILIGEFTQIASGAAPLPAVSSFVPILTMSTIAPNIAMTLRAATSGSVVIVSTNPEVVFPFDKSLKFEIAAETDIRINIAHGRRECYIMSFAVHEADNPLISPPLTKTVLKNAQITQFSRFFGNAYLTHLDLSGNYMSEAARYTIVQDLLNAPANGYLDISNQTTSADPHAGLAGAIEQLRAHGWTVVTD